MLEKNVDLVLARVRDCDRVLDIGGWAQPFTRANVVVDVLPYDTRGIFGNQGQGPEHFGRDSWILHDVSSCLPLPFRDKEFDFVICSHTLEDIRDPIHLCSEINRVGKRGYIETPSRAMESIMGYEGKNYAGCYHHRWLVQIKDNEVVFRFKTHLIHEKWKYHLPRSYIRNLTDEERVAFLLWEGSFSYKEAIQLSAITVANELEQFVKSRNAYHPLRYCLSNFCGSSKRKIKDLMRAKPAVRKIIEKIIRRKVNLGSEEFWKNIPEISSK